MSGEGASFLAGGSSSSPGGGGGLLRGSRTRSYGSLVRSPLWSPVSPVRQRRVEHKIQPGETLQGLALKYGVSMEQIKRANRLYTNDSIFLKTSLWIPLELCSNGLDSASEDSEDDSAQHGRTARTSSSEDKPDAGQGEGEGEERVVDLTPVDFLKRLDGLISQSKQAAARACEGADKRVAALEAACSSSSSRTSEWRPLTRSQSDIISSSRTQQQQAVPLTVTKLTKNLREREDEIFQL